MPFNPRIWMRKLHRWGAVVIAAPFIIVIGTGLLLLLKKEVSWIQPPTKRGSADYPSISFDMILQKIKTIPECEVESWADIDRLDVRPSRGIVKVRCNNRWEVQLDAQTGEVLQLAYRRSDLIESIHDGSWFNDHAKLWVFLPAAVIVLGLWMTGLYLFVLPYAVKWSRKKPKPIQADPQDPA